MSGRKRLGSPDASPSFRDSRSKTRRESSPDYATRDRYDVDVSWIRPSGPSSTAPRNPMDQISNPHRALSPSSRLFCRQSELSRLPQTSADLNLSSGSRPLRNNSPQNRDFQATSHQDRLQQLAKFSSPDQELQPTRYSESRPSRNIPPTNRHSSNQYPNPGTPVKTSQFPELHPGSIVATPDYRLQQTSTHQDYFGNRSLTNHRPQGDLSDRQMASHSRLRNSIFSGRLENIESSRPLDDASILENIGRQEILSGFVREFIDSQRGILEIHKVGSNQVLSEPVPVFFHSSHIWLSDRNVGPPVRFVDVRYNSLLIEKVLPIGSSVFFIVMRVDSPYFKFGCLGVWPVNTPIPPTPSVSQEYTLESYVLDFNKNPTEFVQATLYKYPNKDDLTSAATIWQIKDDYGLIEVKGGGANHLYRFFCLFHKDQIWLKDGPRVTEVDFLMDKPLGSIVRMGDKVCLSARSIVESSGKDLCPSVLELQAVAVILDGNDLPRSCPKPSRLPKGNGTFGATGSGTWYYLNRDLCSNLNQMLKMFLWKYKKTYPNLNQSFISEEPSKVEGYPPLRTTDYPPSLIGYPPSSTEHEQGRSQESRDQPTSSYSIPTREEISAYISRKRSLEKGEAGNSSKRFQGHRETGPGGRLPLQLFHDQGIVDRFHGTDIIILRCASKSIDWLCLVHVKQLYSSRKSSRELNIAFPLNTMLCVNAVLIDEKEKIQYLARLAWDTNELVLSSHESRSYELPLDASGLELYHSFVRGKPLEPVIRSSPAKVAKILDTNFGILETETSLVLFDSCDVWLNKSTTLDQTGQPLDRILKEGSWVVFNATLINTTAKIPYLATAVWQKKDQNLSTSNAQTSLTRSQIPAGKIDNLNFILSAVESSSLSIPSHKPDPNRVNCSIHALKCRVLSQPRDDCVIVESLKGSSRCLVPMNNIRPIPLGDIASTYPLGTTLFVNQVLICAKARVEYLGTMAYKETVKNSLSASDKESVKFDDKDLEMFHVICSRGGASVLPPPPTIRSSSSSSNVPNIKNENICQLCPGRQQHQIQRCQTFLKKNVTSRINFVTEAKICPHCLTQGHDMSRCQNELNLLCGVEGCNEFHHQLLHQSQVQSHSILDIGISQHPRTLVGRHCPHCFSLEHQLKNCPGFLSELVHKRAKIVKKQKICLHCLTQGHFTPSCPQWPKIVCGIEGCDRFHHPLLHKVKRSILPPSQTTSTLSKSMNIPSDSSRRNQDRSGATCIYCKSRNHYQLSGCKVFLRRGSKRRARFVFANNICSHCLNGEHEADMCSENRGLKCGIDGCTSNHHRLLHTGKDAKHVANAVGPCPKGCLDDHPLSECPSFLRRHVTNRSRFVSINRICNHCLSSDHTADTCTEKVGVKCGIGNCTSNHHPLLHSSKDAKIPVESKSAVTGTCPIGSCSDDHQLFECPLFQRRTVKSRKRFVQKHKICNHCLSNEHTSDLCSVKVGVNCGVDNCTTNHHPMLHHVIKVTEEITDGIHRCPLGCSGGSHRLSECPKFLKRTNTNRIKVATTKKLCQHCLGVSHTESACTEREGLTCGINGCNETHHPLLHCSDCPLCSDNHRLEHCQRFIKKTVEKRLAFVKEKKICSHCLYDSHPTETCPTEKGRLCRIDGCRKLEHPLLHNSKKSKTNSKPKCSLCFAEHKLPECHNFIKKTTKERFSFVDKNELCHHCLLGAHSVRDCKTNPERTCGVDGCKRYEHPLIHKPAEQSGDQNDLNRQDKGQTEKVKVCPKKDADVLKASRGTIILLSSEEKEGILLTECGQHAFFDITDIWNTFIPDAKDAKPELTKFYSSTPGEKLGSRMNVGSIVYFNAVRINCLDKLKFHATDVWSKRGNELLVKHKVPFPKEPKFNLSERKFSQDLAKRCSRIFSCVCCSEIHFTRDCEIFQNLSKEERKAMTVREKLCIHCLVKTSHSLKSCKWQKENLCRINGCKNLHHPLLHGAKVLKTVTEPKQICTYCHLDHTIFECGEFIKLSVVERRTVARDRKFCSHCLRSDHDTQVCTWNPGWKCRIDDCEMLHHPMLHQKRRRSEPIPSGECPVCSCFHSLAECWEFYSISPGHRRRLVIKTRSCFICLREGHDVKSCPVEDKKCGYEGCQIYHHALLHKKPDWPEIVKMSETVVNDLIDKMFCPEKPASPDASDIKIEIKEEPEFDLPSEDN